MLGVISAIELVALQQEKRKSVFVPGINWL